MPLGAEHEQTAGIEHLLLLGGDLGLDPLDRGIALGPFGHVAKLVIDAELDIAAKLDVGAAARHVGGDGHRAQTARLRHDMRFLLVEARVEHAVLDAFLVQELGQHFRLLDRDGADQNRLAGLVFLADRLGDRLELVGRVLVELVLLVDTADRVVGRDGDHVHLVDVEEFGRFGRGGAGHARKLGIHAEIVLEGDRGERLILGLDLHAFLRLDRLVQAVRPAAAIHHAPGELVDDDDLVVLDDIVDVALEHHIGLERLIEMVDDLGVLDVVQVAADQKAGLFKQPLGLFGAVLGQDHRARLLVLLVIGLVELEHDRVDRDVHF